MTMCYIDLILTVRQLQCFCCSVQLKHEMSSNSLCSYIRYEHARCMLHEEYLYVILKSECMYVA